SGRLLRHEPDRILQRLTRPEMIRREDADDDRLALTLEHPEEIAGLVRDREPGDVARNTRAVELAAHDAQHRIGCRLVDERAALHLLQQAAHFTRRRETEWVLALAVKLFRARRGAQRREPASAVGDRLRFLEAH